MAYCIYLRKSRADIEAEARGEGETLARHEKLLLEVAQKGHYPITQIYREIVSGETIAARPVVQQLLREVEDGVWEGVLVAEVERLARGDTIDQGRVSQAFKYSGARIITPSKVYDPNNEFDEEYFEFGLFMSRREYKTINRRLQRGRIASVKEGKWAPGSTPYGYERVRIKGDKGWTLRPVEEQAGVVRLIFRLYTSGEEMADGSIRQFGTFSIARRLDEIGISPPRASYWNNQTVLAILKNPVYIGKVRWQTVKSRKKIVNNSLHVEYFKAPPEEAICVDGLHPAIIDEAVFFKAQELLQHSGASPLPANRTSVNPLAGILRCGLCGRNMGLRRSKRASALFCPNRNCHNVGSYYDIVEKHLLQALSDWLSDYRLKWSDNPPVEEQALIDIKSKSLRKAKTELETLRKQLDRTHDLLEQGVYDTEAFLARSRSLNDRISAAVANIENLSAEIQEDEQRAACRANIIPDVEKLLDVYAALPTVQAKNEMLKSVLEKVEYVKYKPCVKGENLDNFELTIYPKLPPSSVK